jgi:hypothetical protein
MTAPEPSRARHPRLPRLRPLSRRTP